MAESLVPNEVVEGSSPFRRYRGLMIWFAHLFEDILFRDDECGSMQPGVVMTIVGIIPGEREIVGQGIVMKSIATRGVRDMIGGGVNRFFRGR